MLYFVNTACSAIHSW